MSSGHRAFKLAQYFRTRSTMPTLRSASSKASGQDTPKKRSKAQAISEDEDVSSELVTPTPKRSPRKKARVEDSAEQEAVPETVPTTPKRKLRGTAATPKKTPSASTGELVTITVPRGPEPELVPAQLAFDLDAAYAHLIKADSRFAELFQRRPCKPFVLLNTVDPFRTLCTSILSQQISTLAARSIGHRLCRMYDPSLPEKYENGQNWDLFPTAQQVAATPLPALRAAGLSTRKAEYLHDLAAHFADGRITTHKLREATDEQLSEMLTAVRGIGPWTVHMFALFSLRHPDILPVGDLGVQKGLARWILGAHSPKDAVTLPVEETEGGDEEIAQADEPAPRATTAEPDAASELPAPMLPPGTPKRKSVELGDASGNAEPLLPPPFTPSLNRVLNAQSEAPPIPLPDGISVALLRSRLAGKTKVKGAILTPTEMEQLTNAWRPYRSIGVWYMWALLDNN